MKTIVFASMNAKKTSEIQRMVPPCIKILCLKDIPEAQGVPQAEENGTTFLENAEIKAKYWAEKLDMAVLAEDSGLEIKALNNFPGVMTKRCIKTLNPNADIDADAPEELYPFLIDMMKKTGKNTTEATWSSAIVLIDGNKKLSACESLKGNMCSCAGEKVFGFDQYFKPFGFEKTLSQMTAEEKDSVGPRLKALESIILRM